MRKFMGVQVGDTFTAHYRYGDYCRPIVVTKVGNKWVYFGRKDRFNMATGIIDGGQMSSPGRVYFSEADYLASKFSAHLFDRLVALMSAKPSESVGQIQIAKIAEIMGLSESVDWSESAFVEWRKTVQTKLEGDHAMGS